MNSHEEAQIQALRLRAEGGDPVAQANLAQALIGPDFDEALVWMEKAAASGLAEALYFLGVWHTEGVFKERDMKAGLKYLTAAEEKGLPLARHYMAYLKAKGIGGAPDWAGALADVSGLAKKGNPFALSQIGFLLKMTSSKEDGALGEIFIRAAASGGNPQALNYFKNQKPDHRQVSGQDLEAAKKALRKVPNPPLPKAKHFSEKPLIAILPGIISPGIADYLVSRALPGLKPSLVIDNIHGKSVEDRIRTSTEHRFMPSKADLVTHALCGRIALAAGEPVDHQEFLGVLRYRPGQEYKPHSDFMKADAEGKNPEVERAGQRVKTFLIYLNEEFTAGETEFPRLGLRIKPGKGDGLLFVNVKGSGEESRLSVHAGRPVETGEKFITTLWIRDKTYTFPPPKRGQGRYPSQKNGPDSL